MGTITGFAVRIACVVAIVQQWGWFAGVVAIVAGFLIPSRKDWFGRIDMSSVRTWIRFIGEIAVVVFGIIAARALWGDIWSATFLIIYVISFVTSKQSL